MALNISQRRKLKHKTGPLHQVAVCPNCGEKTSFYCIGIQEWPERVARIHNMPRTVVLWNCYRCKSTVTLS